MSQAVRIAILDAVPESFWADDEGITDSQKFIDLLQPLNPAAEFSVYYVSRGQFPERIEEFDAILITGSPCSVHDRQAWIDRLTELVREARRKRLRLIGSCFGHQLVARAFGGEVGFNEGGWLIGSYKLQIHALHTWMTPIAEEMNLFHFNQERVTRLPAGARSFASTGQYEDFAYTLDEHILCFQGHPEQPRRAMLNFLKVMDDLDAKQLAEARERIDAGPPDDQHWGQWIMQFILQASASSDRGKFQ